MGDSLPPSGEPRMLERRVSNQQNQLTNSQQLNFLLAWFQDWSDLEKEDFVPVLASKMSSKWAMEHINGITEEMGKLNTKTKPVLLFHCQVKLFKEWVMAWSDDQKNYLILRLKEIDQNFSKKYEHFLEFGKDSPIRDYFEPGIPPELDLSIDRSSEASEPVDVSLKEVEEADECATISEEPEEPELDLESYTTDDDLCKPSAAVINNPVLSPIAEDGSSPSSTLTDLELSEKIE